MDKLPSTENVEDVSAPNRTISDKDKVHGDRAVQILGGQRVTLTAEDNKHIRQKTDKVILTILAWVYFLQILDKTVFGYGALFGMRQDSHLQGNQYSFLGSVNYIAQIGWQPFSSWLIVKVPHRILMPALVLGWGIAQACMAASHSFGGLVATRFLLGLFEAGCLPLFSIITSQWYRRAEQPMRVAIWYGTNGLGNIVAAGLSYGLGHVHSPTLFSWQIIFLFVGLLTIASVPFIYWRLDNDVASARFLTEHEKQQALERLRDNQTGTGSHEFKWTHIWEAALEPKTWLWLGMSLLLNVGASVTSVFGPLILQGFGFDKYTTSLLSMPFGAVQVIVILCSSYLAQKCRIKSAILATFMLPVIVGLAMLYTLGRSKAQQAPLLVAYYLLACLYGGNPLIVSWIVGNTGGTTKKSAIMSLYQAGSSAGNIIGPLLFSSKDQPYYHPGLRKVLAIFVTLVAVIMIQLANLMFLNKLQQKKRVSNGKKAILKDRSMENRYRGTDEMDEDSAEMESAHGQRIGDNAFLDLSDRKNDEFIYIY